MRCQICNYCEETRTPSEYYTEFPITGNKVKYRPTLGMVLCDECKEGIKYNNITYKTQDLENKIIKEVEELFKEDNEESVSKDTLTLPEVQ